MPVKPGEHQIGLVTSLSRRHLVRILKAGGVSWQTTTTWKSRNDPDFIAKMQRILALYDAPPADGRVVCVDEFRPLNLQSRKGKAWRLSGRPARLRATSNRNDGVRHLLGALDLATGRLYYRIRGRKRWQEFLAFLNERLHVVLDNYSPRSQSMGSGQRRRAGVPAHLRLLAELDRIRVRRAALLRVQRHRPPQP